MNNILLEEAKRKFYCGNDISNNDYNLEINDFICKIYSNCIPSLYGKEFVKKIKYDLNRIDNVNLYSVTDSADCGDLCLIYPKIEQNYFSSQYYYEENYQRIFIPWGDVIKQWYEVKISYLSRSNDTFRLNNIRPYQHFDKFIICFVDCDRNFEPMFMVIDKENITKNYDITLTPSNGTKKANLNNDEIGYSTSFKKDSYKLRSLIKYHNNLNGTSYVDLVEYLKNESLSMKNKFVLSKVKLNAAA